MLFDFTYSIIVNVTNPLYKGIDDMDFKWLSDMLDSIGVKMGSKYSNKHDPSIREIENEIAQLQYKLDKEELDLMKVKRRSNFLNSLSGISFLFGLFILHSFWGAVIASAIISSIANSEHSRKIELKNSLSSGKARLERKKIQLAELRRTLGHNSSQYFENINEEDMTKEYKEVYVNNKDNREDTPAENSPETIAEEASKEEVIEGADRYPGSTIEAIKAYVNLEKISEMLPKLRDHDNITAQYLQDAFDSAMKVAKFIHGDMGKENRGFIFYNQVETLEKWTRGILELESKDVYDSLLVNVKEKVKIAVPKLQEKINKEYYKFVNPDIMDLESEMTVMSKEVY